LLFRDDDAIFIIYYLLKMNSKSIMDAQAAYADYLKNAQAKGIEVVSSAIAKAQQHADEMGP